MPSLLVPQKMRRWAARCLTIYISGWVTQTVDLGSHTLFIALVADKLLMEEQGKKAG